MFAYHLLFILASHIAHLIWLLGRKGVSLIIKILLLNNFCKDPHLERKEIRTIIYAFPPISKIFSPNTVSSLKGEVNYVKICLVILNITGLLLLESSVNFRFLSRKLLIYTHVCTHFIDFIASTKIWTSRENQCSG